MFVVASLVLSGGELELGEAPEVSRRLCRAWAAGTVAFGNEIL